jgi:hypothetical protein
MMSPSNQGSAEITDVGDVLKDFFLMRQGPGQGPQNDLFAAI